MVSPVPHDSTSFQFPVQEMQEMQVLSMGSEDPLGTPLKYSCLENSMGRGAWGATVHEDRAAKHTSSLGSLILRPCCEMISDWLLPSTLLPAFLARTRRKKKQRGTT